MLPSIWIAELRISERTAAKLRTRHNIDPDDVRRNIVCVAGLHYAEHIHETYGRRALLVITIRTSRTLVVLYPTADPDVWNLGSAYQIER